jgi:hypothetical protein
MGQIVQNCRRWTGNLLVIDPKGENLELSWQDRAAMGQKVYGLDPFRVARIPDEIRASFNVLGAVDPASPRARAQLMAIGNGLVVSHDPKHMEWTSTARAILAGLAGYVLTAVDDPAAHTLASLRACLMQPVEFEGDEGAGLLADAQEMANSAAFGGLVRNAGVTILRAIEESRSKEAQCLSLARESTAWLDDPAIAETLSHSTFDLTELKTGNASVYLVLPADGDYMVTYAAFLRVFVKSALQAMGANGEGSGRGKKCLFLLDEFYSLGKMEEIAESVGRMASYGVHLWPFLQSFGQLLDLYGAAISDTFFANADAACFFGVAGDMQSLEYVSRRAGSITLDEVDRPPVVVPYDYRKHWIGQGGGTEEEAKERLRVRQENERRDYEHARSLVGSPRITPQEVAALTGKGNNDTIARAMIVFAKANDVLHLRLRAYTADNHNRSASIATKQAVAGQIAERARALQIEADETITRRIAEAGRARRQRREWKAPTVGEGWFPLLPTGVQWLIIAMLFMAFRPTASDTWALLLLLWAIIGAMPAGYICTLILESNGIIKLSQTKAARPPRHKQAEP